jgi:preprotein translocase subunit SecE
VSSKLTTILIWVVVIGAAFAYAWWKGYILKFRDYWNATVEELRKCSWPTWDELKGSTLVVSISIALLSIFTVAVDYAFAYLVRWISS